MYVYITTLLRIQYFLDLNRAQRLAGLVKFISKVIVTIILYIFGSSIFIEYTVFQRRSCTVIYTKGLI